LCDFKPLEITPPCTFQQQGMHFPALNHLYVCYVSLFYIINIVGTWEGVRAVKTGKIKSVLEGQKKNGLSIPQADS
jgi:hypothetical protein